MKLTYYDSIEVYPAPDLPEGWRTSVNRDGPNMFDLSPLAKLEDPYAGLVVEIAINDRASLVIAFEDQETGTAALAIDVAESDIKKYKELYLCPSCGSDGPFNALCPYDHKMLKDGRLKRRIWGKSHAVGSIPTYCPTCGQHDHRGAFFVKNWRPFNCA